MSHDIGVPRCWKSALVGDVCDLATGGTPKSAQRAYYKGGAIRWLVSGDVHRVEIRDCEGRITEAGVKNSNAKLLPAGSVIIALNGQGKTRGTVAILRTEATCNQSLVSINPHDRNKLLPEFLFWNLRGRYEELRRLTGDTGNERRGLNMPLIRSIRIPLPSLDEQKRIVALLDEAFATLDRARVNTEANLADSEALFDAWLTSVFHDHSSSWRTEKLHSLCRQITVGHVGPMAERYTEVGIPFLRSQNIRPFEVALNDVKRIDEQFHNELAKSALVPGDVAIVRTGYPGTAAVIPESLPVSNCADLVIVRPKESVSPEFLVMFLNSTFGKQMVADKAVGAAQKHFNVGAAKQVDFSFPVLAEQERLVLHARKLRAHAQGAQESYRSKLADIATLRQSLLQAAFSGQLN